jgi:hypothetical protein
MATGAGEPERRIGADAALSMGDLVDAPVRAYAGIWTTVSQSR